MYVIIQHSDIFSLQDKVQIILPALFNVTKISPKIFIFIKKLIQWYYTMHNNFSNFLCFASFCAHLCAISNNFNCNDEQMKPRIYRRHPLNRQEGSVSKIHIRCK